MCGRGHDLERQRGERLVRDRGALDRLALGVDAGGGRDVVRRRHVEAHRVEQRLHALVLEGRAVEHGHHVVVEAGVADRGAEVLVGDLLLAEVLLHDVVVGLGQHVDQLVAVVVGQLDHVGGDVGDLPARAEVLGLPDPGLHRDQVDDAGVVALGADRQVDHRRLGLQPVLDRGRARRRSPRPCGPSC